MGFLYYFLFTIRFHADNSRQRKKYNKRKFIRQFTIDNNVEQNPATNVSSNVFPSYLLLPCCVTLINLGHVMLHSLFLSLSFTLSISFSYFLSLKHNSQHLFPRILKHKNIKKM